MLGDVARSQAQALRDWAAMWEAEAVVGTGPVPFLLRRAAVEIERCAGLAPAMAPGDAAAVADERRVVSEPRVG